MRACARVCVRLDGLITTFVTRACVEYRFLTVRLKMHFLLEKTSLELSAVNEVVGNATSSKSVKYNALGCTILSLILIIFCKYFYIN